MTMINRQEGETGMTKEEAIKELTEIRDYVHAKQDNEIFEADTTSLDMAIEALVAQQWIPCSERLPNKDEVVFVYLFGDSPYNAWWDGRDWNTDDFTIEREEEPLAWMPLPEPWKGDEA